MLENVRFLPLLSITNHREPTMKICVYCASSDRVDPAYFLATEKLANEFARAGAEVVFGGGGTGLMGRLADAILDNGGKIRGVIPRFMDNVEWTHQRLTEVEFTETMQERKTKLFEKADAIVALPGGTGTLEELLEAITLKRLGVLTLPIVILNTKNYYDPLKTMLHRCVDENFMKPKHLEMWAFVNEPEEVIPAIQNAARWDSDSIKFAVVK